MFRLRTPRGDLSCLLFLFPFLRRRLQGMICVSSREKIAAVRPVKFCMIHAGCDETGLPQGSETWRRLRGAGAIRLMFGMDGCVLVGGILDP